MFHSKNNSAQFFFIMEKYLICRFCFLLYLKYAVKCLLLVLAIVNLEKILMEHSYLHEEYIIHLYSCCLHINDIYSLLFPRKIQRKLFALQHKQNAFFSSFFCQSPPTTTTPLDALHPFHL